MKKNLTLFPVEINIKWKLTFWAAFLILIIFFSYNSLQYFVIQGWVVNQEKQTIQKKMQEVIAYIKDTYPQKNISQSEKYLDTLNEKYQMIRVVKKDNKPLFTISDEVPQNVVAPKYVKRKELVKITPHGDQLLIFREPIEVKGFTGTVEIVRNMENFDSLMNQVFIIMIVTGIGAIVLSLLGGRLISFQLLKPIKSIITTMKKIKENGLTERVAVSTHHDEMTELGVMFNELMDNLEKSFIQQQHFVEDASHELKTPLSIIHGHLSLINRWGKENPEVFERSIQLSLNQTNRLIHLVSELLELSRHEVNEQDQNHIDKIELVPVLNDIVENFQLINNDFTIILNLYIENDLFVKISKRHLEQILVILLDNAVKYSNDQRIVQVNIGKIDNELNIEVKDFGIGVPKKELPFILNRFYRVDKARTRKSGGNGLGLAIAKRIVENYKGDIKIESVKNKWTKVVVTLPIFKNTQ